jgi:hypothetical protein
MDSLYIVNATPRIHHLHYRITEDVRVFDAKISPGGQFKIPDKHCSPEDLKHIINQITVYGAKTREEVGRDKDFSGIIYGHKPISIESIRQGLAEVDELAIERAIDLRTKNAISADAKVAALAQEAGTGVGSLEVEFAEQATPGGDNENLQRQTIQVQREGQPKSERSRATANKARGSRG